MDATPVEEAHNTGVVPIGDARRLMNEMEAPIKEIVEKALQKQANEIAERTQRLKGDMSIAHKKEVDELKRQLEAVSGEMEKREVERSEWHAEKKKLMEKLAPLEVWARIILPDASSAAYKNSSNRAAAWRVDGKYSICSTGVATKDTSKIAKPKNIKDTSKNASTNMGHSSTNTPNSSSSFIYDRVFDPASTNLDVYNALSVYVKHGVESKHLMLFMYGHSGTGKSQTLIHPYKSKSAPGDKRDHSPLIERILEKAFAQRIDGDGHVSARITCLEYRSGHFYDLAAAKAVATGKSKSMLFTPKDGTYRIKDETARSHELIAPIFTSAENAINHIRASDGKRGEGKTTENNKSSRGHAWYEVRMYPSSKKNGNDGQKDRKEEEEDAALGVYTFFDLGGLEPLQIGSGGVHGAKKESSTLTDALKALNTPLRVIAAGKSDWGAPSDNMFVQAITRQLKGEGDKYGKFGRPQIIVLGHVNGFEDNKEPSREVLDRLLGWRTLR
ncbi:hypothetical protein HBH92_221890 [Parastagonospora nodorum]|nr:hypothetical protein HBH50_202360 [Parastagonospora nodorum]KAH4081563.1 hypothetical protein HBH48_198010 [Parastagonospora nodorum]KAH4084450.1 hypothetical protein HBH46_212760 [Parastagonospora nodorum]KAH4401625.1 hypothetical protein HBH92_221890 [Parastagonospora nodorum]KAH4406193.1 hypothetical protein HBH93_230350 [Parastagonospora nodorum]